MKKISQSNNVNLKNTNKMKRKLLLFLSALLICGSMSAQGYSNHYNYDGSTENNMTFRAKVCIDGVEQQSTNVIEIGAFKGNIVTDGKFVKPFGTNNYYRVNMTIGGGGSNSDYPITFKLYDHANNVELLNYTITDPNGNVLDGITWHVDDNLGTFMNPYVLNFRTTQTIDLAINGYGNGNGNWYLITSPLEGTTTVTNVTNMTANEYDLYYFDQTKELEWVTYKPGDNNVNPGFGLVAGKGYLYANSGDVTLKFRGVPYDGDGQVTLTRATAPHETMEGWNLVGNPWNESATIGRYSLRMNETRNNLITVEDPNESIARLEGVFVYAEEDGETVTFTKGSKSRSIDERIVLNLNSNGNVIDRAIIGIGDGQTLPKFQLKDNSTKLYLMQDKQEFAVVRSNGQGEMPVNFKASADGNYTIAVSIKDVEMDYLHLVDNLTGADIDLLQTSNYTFNAKSDDYASRFKLVFSANIDDTDNDFAFINNGEIIITDTNANATLQIVDVTGRILFNRSATHSVSTANLAEGVYVLRLINGSDVKTQKIVIK